MLQWNALSDRRTKKLSETRLRKSDNSGCGLQSGSVTTDFPKICRVPGKEIGRPYSNGVFPRQALRI